MALVLAAPGAVIAAAADVQPTQQLIIGLDEAPPELEGSWLAGARVTSVNPVLRFAVVETDEPAAVAQRLAADPNVRYVEPVVEFLPAFVPDDARLSEQYGARHVGAIEAWDTTAGGGSKNVCIVDTGVRYTHEDLAANWRGGYDFFNDDPDPWDDFVSGHGTHVAGTAAASIDNGVGVAGMADVGILGAKVFGSSGGTPSDALANAIQWCADNGGDVISMSIANAWIVHPAARSVEDAVWHALGGQVVQEAATYAWSQGALLVAAAGNSGPCDNCVSFIASMPEIIAVTCTTSSRAQCDFSSDGPQAELAAPGQGILSTCSGGDSDYCFKQGTSMSTPHVSGVAALVWNHAPYLTNQQLRQILQETATDIGSPGWDARFGYGMVNASAALANLPPPGPDGAPSCELLEPKGGLDAAGVVPLTVRSVANVSSVDRVEVEIEEGGAPVALAPTTDPTVFTGVLDTQTLADGELGFRVECEDPEGATAVLDQVRSVENLVVAIDGPASGDVVAGTTDVVVDVFASRGVDQVLLSIDGGPETDITSTFNGTHYVVPWDSTTHARDDVPASISVRAVDASGASETDLVTGLRVDNLPEPSVGITEPAHGTMIVAPTQTVRVEAVSATGDDPIVEVSINGRAWIDITDTRDGNEYTYEWSTLNEPLDGSTIRARATDAGGTADDSVRVTTPLTPAIGQIRWVISCVHFPAEPAVPCPKGIGL